MLGASHQQGDILKLSLSILTAKISPLQKFWRRSSHSNIEPVRQKARAATNPLKTVSLESCGSKHAFPGLVLPEYYLVYFLLVDLLGFQNLGTRDKVAWSIPVDLGGEVLFIEHRKWGLGVFSSDDHNSDDAAREVGRLVWEGVKVAQPYFDWRAETAVASSKVNVRNISGKLFQRFEFLLDLYEAKRSESQESSKVGPTEESQPFFVSHREIQWLALSTIESFFSWTEHVFIHLAILQGRCTSGEKIDNLARAEWKSKFKVALDINDPTAKQFYDKLLLIRNEVRNFVAHGAFGKQREAFLFHSDAGEVPVQLRDHQDGYSFRFPKSLLTEENLLSLLLQKHDSSEHDAIALILEFIEYIRSGSLAPAWIYLDYGLNSNLTMALNGEYSLAMKSEETMTELVKELSYRIDRQVNMDFLF